MKSDKARNSCVDYIEFPAGSLDELTAAKRFYGSVFGWVYKDWGNEYADTESSGVGTGINADVSHQPRQPLVVIYAELLEAARAKVAAAGGKISRDIFAFLGGRRFHFVDPAGSELAVWSDRQK
jgi:predicted enzyme related to lactoylglutathione lyase